MAAKKYYAVRTGKTTGVFKTWDECRNAVEGYPGAQYKGFSTLEEAEEYLGVKGTSVGQLPPKTRQGRILPREERAGEMPVEGGLLAYVDGSYDDSIKKYAFGCVFLLPDGRIYTEYGNGDNEQSLQHRNVTGEMLGAMYAVKTAMLNGFQSVEIRYDYQGIEKWVTGEWRSKTELTRKYAVSMREWGKSISIRFTKVAAHTNVRYNELADKMAKKGLTSGNGVPKVRRLEDMEEYGGANETE
ncbi:MAG: ribonuclease H family protein [Eubacterium sp.]|nr:ribonuclease H family protein [Eubacterium sp.]MCM1217846.1 ribonuclease H family protein [Lachnospiraceae bacterium]MCM1240923.1 ribonuclease H family protein [Lachnospiraceae bacterium]